MNQPKKTLTWPDVLPRAGNRRLKKLEILSPSCLAPGKRPRLTPNPAIVINPGQWAMPLGTPGNDVQTQAMVEILLNIHLHKMSVQGAIKK